MKFITIWILGSTYVMFMSALQSHKGVMWVLFGISAIVSLLFIIEVLLPFKIKHKIIKWANTTINKQDEDSSSRTPGASR